MLHGIDEIAKVTPIRNVIENFISYFDYSLLQSKNFVDVHIDDTDVYGNDLSSLISVSDPRYQDGQVWKYPKAPLVWESGVGALTNSDPAYPGVSGIYIDNTFYPRSTTGQYEYIVDHINGLVIFTNGPIATTSVVKGEYSYKFIKIVRTDSVEWFKQITSNYKDTPEKRIMLSDSVLLPPLIGVEFLNARYLPYSLGGGKMLRLTCLLHCVAEDSYMRDFTIDACLMQKETVFNAFDLNKIHDNDDLPIDIYGVPKSSAKTYNELVTAYKTNSIAILEAEIDSIYRVGLLHIGTIRIVLEQIIFA